MVRRQWKRLTTPGASASRRGGRLIALGLTIAVTASAMIGIHAVARSAETGRTTAALSPKSSVTIAKVAATSTGLVVRTTLRVTNSTSSRTAAVHAWLYLGAGSEKYVLGQVAVGSLAAGASTTVSAVHAAPRRAGAGTYAVLGCTGAYSAQNCHASAASCTCTSPTTRTSGSRARSSGRPSRTPTSTTASTRAA